MVETGREGMTHEKTLSLRLDHALASCQRGMLDAALNKELADGLALTDALSQLRSIASGLRCYLSRVLLNDANIRHAYPLLFEIVKEHNWFCVLKHILYVWLNTSSAVACAIAGADKTTTEDFEHEKVEEKQVDNGAADDWYLTVSFCLSCISNRLWVEIGF